MGDPDETGGIGLLLDEVIAAVGTAAGAYMHHAVVIAGRRAYATDGYRMHTADLPRDSPAVNPPLLLAANPLRYAMRGLLWRAKARITSRDDVSVTVSVPQQEGGTLLAEIPVSRNPAPVLDEPFERYAGPPAAALTVDGQYLIDALQLMSAGRNGARHPVTLHVYPDALVVVTGDDGRQRAAVIAARRDEPVRPWWWHPASGQGAD
jgi:hypothetical protein